MTLTWHEATKSLEGYLGVSKSRLMTCHRLCFHMIWLLCPANPAMTVKKTSDLTSDVNSDLQKQFSNMFGNFKLGLSNAVLESIICPVLWQITVVKRPSPPPPPIGSRIQKYHIGARVNRIIGTSWNSQKPFRTSDPGNQSGYYCPLYHTSWS